MKTFFAYIDPFTGSIVLQVLAMGFFGLLAFFRQIKSLVANMFGFGKKEVETENAADQTIRFPQATASDDSQSDTKAA